MSNTSHEQLTHILLVDDSPADLRRAQQALERIRAEDRLRLACRTAPGDIAVEVATTLAVAEAAQRHGRGEVVLLDLDLVDSSGLATLDALLAVPAAGAVVAMLDHDDRDLAHEALARGAADFVVKAELETSVLPRAIGRALQQRERAVEHGLASALSRLDERARFQLGLDALAALVAEEARASTGAAAAALMYEAPARDLGARPAAHLAMAGPEGARALVLADGASEGAQDVVRDELERLCGVPLGALWRLPLNSRAADPHAPDALWRRPQDSRDADPHAPEATLLLAARSGMSLPPGAHTVAVGLAVWAHAALYGARLAELHAHALGVRERMLSVISHDLRNPLGVIATAAELMRMSDDSAVRGRFADQTRRSVEQMGRLIGDMLDLSALEAGTLTLDKANLEPAGLLREACNTAAVQAADKRVRVRCDAPAELPRVDVDGTRFLQLLGNLLDHAIRVSPEGAEVVLTAAVTGSALTVELTDQGPAITEADKASHFGHSTQQSRGVRGRTGLTLLLARGLARAHGSDLAIEDAGTGARFRFPIALSAPG